jgi:hypothetical protein
MFAFLLFSFSGLFGSNTKDVSPKRSTTSKHSSTTDQIAPTKSTDEILSSERSVNERFEYFLLIIFFNIRDISATEDDTRFEVYGWSLSSVSDEKVQANVPVPVYCRPVFNTNDKTQV